MVCISWQGPGAVEVTVTVVIVVVVPDVVVSVAVVAVVAVAVVASMQHGRAHWSLQPLITETLSHVNPARAKVSQLALPAQLPAHLASGQSGGWITCATLRPAKLKRLRRKVPQIWGESMGRKRSKHKKFGDKWLRWSVVFYKRSKHKKNHKTSRKNLVKTSRKNLVWFLLGAQVLGGLGSHRESHQVAHAPRSHETSFLGHCRWLKSTNMYESVWIW